MAKFEINNPVALKWISDFKTGVLFLPFIEKVRRYKMVLVSLCIFLLLIVFATIGKKLYEKTQVPVFLPPTPAGSYQKKATETTSEFENLRQEVVNFNTDLPDPALPPTENKINLEETNL